MKSKIRIEHSNQAGTLGDFGYGLYIIAIANGCVYASVRLPRNATQAQIKAAEKKVRASASRALAKESR